MEGVGARAGGDIDRAGGGHAARQVQRGLLDLKFLNGAGGNVHRGGSHVFVADVAAIHLNAGGASVPAAEGDRREAILGGVEDGAILDLNPGSSCANCRKLRPLMGKFSICVVVMTPCTVACSVFTWTRVAATSTMVVVEPTCSATLPLDVLFTCTVRVISAVEKPAASTRTVYSPGVNGPEL